MASMKLLLAVALCLAVSANAQRFDTTGAFTCPTGWLPFVSSAGTTCAPDPCFGTCGTGNTCTPNVLAFSGATILRNACNCRPPTVLSQVIYRDYCFVPGTDVCNPSPCKNGATCETEIDFNGLPGAYRCNNCPLGISGRNCDLPGPTPTPTPRGLPVGGPNPYTTF